MKRRDLLKHLLQNGCLIQREGGEHTIVVHRGNRRRSALPRHNEIPDHIARDICKQLGVPRP